MHLEQALQGHEQLSTTLTLEEAAAQEWVAEYYPALLAWMEFHSHAKPNYIAAKEGVLNEGLEAYMVKLQQSSKFHHSEDLKGRKLMRYF